jgi:hypothetical protein
VPGRTRRGGRTRPGGPDVLTDRRPWHSRPRERPAGKPRCSCRTTPTRWSLSRTTGRRGPAAQAVIRHRPAACARGLAPPPPPPPAPPPPAAPPPPPPPPPPAPRPAPAACPPPPTAPRPTAAGLRSRRPPPAACGPCCHPPPQPRQSPRQPTRPMCPMARGLTPPLRFCNFSHRTGLLNRFTWRKGPVSTARPRPGSAVPTCRPAGSLGTAARSASPYRRRRQWSRCIQIDGLDRVQQP